VDDISDACFEKIKKDIEKDNGNVDDYVSVMLIVKALERFGDYCTKITKAVHYVASGKRVSEGDF
jgi:phosphate uptake regulator